MNLEVELLKKELQTLRNEMEAMRQEWENSKKHRFYRITYSFRSETHLDAKTFLMKWKECYPTATIHYHYSSYEDPMYQNDTLKIHVYKNDIHLYIELTEPELPETMEMCLSIQPKTLHFYSTLSSLHHEMDFETFLQPL